MNDTSATKGSSGKKERKSSAWIIEEVATQETKSLEQEVAALREENAALQKRVAWLETQLQALKEYLREQTARQQGQRPNQAQRPSQPEPGEPAQQDKAREQGSQATEQAGPGEAPAQAKQSQAQSQAQEGQAPGQSGAAGIAKPVDEEKAEKWIRENLEQWLDKPCPFKKAQGRTWRQMAQNAGEKILIKGKPLPPRAYLHTIESWAACNVWTRLKAKVALEIGKLAACA